MASSLNFFFRLLFSTVQVDSTLRGSNFTQNNNYMLTNLMFYAAAGRSLYITQANIKLQIYPPSEVQRV